MHSKSVLAAVVFAILTVQIVFAASGQTTYDKASGIAPSREAFEKLNALNLSLSEVMAIGKELGVDFAELDDDDMIFVVGESLTAVENAAWEMAKADDPSIAAYAISSSKADVKAIAGSEKLVILIGGPSQNRVTAELYGKNLLSQKRHEYANQLVIITARTNEGARVAIVSDKRGFENMPRRAASYSPLAICLPLQLVPVVASLIGAAVASMLNLIKAYLEGAITDKEKKKRKLSKHKIVGLRPYEILSVMAAAFILGLSVSWTYAGPTWDFIWLMALNTVICVFAGFSHEFIHWLVGRMLKIETEYRFWLAGSAATMFSAVLGNSFGLQGFLIDEVKEGTPKWKIGLMKISSPIFSTVVMVFFAAVNFFIPHVVFQMIYSIAAVLAMVEILPFKPMDGYDIRKWNIIIWFMAFSIISVAYVLVSFIL